MRTALRLGVVLTALWAGFAQADEAWKVLLEQQLVDQEKCQLNYLTDVSVTEAAGIKARAHCEDTRSFDVHMPPGTSKFEIAACKPTYC